MRVITLGTSAGVATSTRNVSSTALVHNGKIFLFDVGEGTLGQMRKANLRLSRIHVIMISHMHGDHINGLPSLLSAIDLDAQGKRRQLVTLIGPVGISLYVDTLQLLGLINTDILLVRRPLMPTKEVVYNDDAYTITAAPLQHRCSCYGFAFREALRPGEFYPREADALGVPAGPAFAALRRGESVISTHGMVVHPEQVIGEPRPGKSFVYCTDTAVCDAGKDLAAGADVLVHDGTYGDDMAEHAATRGHSTARQAAQLAKGAGVGRLILTHISPSVKGDGSLLRSAQEAFRNTIIANDLYAEEW